jgi:hypothetical protein
MVPFEDKNSFALKDEIKLCKGRFDGDKKVWMVPPQAIAHLKELSMRITAHENDPDNKNSTANLWKKACSICGYRFVKKGTEEYDKVKVQFKILLKNKDNGEEEEDEDNDAEDDGVFD